MNKKQIKLLIEAGKKGGKACGVCKVRGDSNYYNKIREKGLKTRRKNKDVKKRNMG